MLQAFLDGAAGAFDGHAWSVVLINAFAKGTLILAAAALARPLLRRSSASLRHLVGATAIVAVLALPVLSALLPSWQVPILKAPPVSFPGAHLVPKPNSEVVSREKELSSARTIGDSVPARSSPTALAAPSAHRTSTPSTTALATGASISSWSSHWFQYWPWIAAGVWLLGVAVLLCRLLFAMSVVAWLVGGARTAKGRGFERLAVALRRRMGLRRKVRLLLSDRLDVALSLGLWRPVVILPAAAEHWSRERLASILLHEFAHVKRWDNALNVLAQAACAFYWLHPLAWWVTGRMVVDRERACDDTVLRQGMRASMYAGHLLEVARSALPSRRAFWRPLEVSQSSALKERLKAILDMGRDRAGAGPRGWVYSLGLFAFMLPLAALQPWSDGALGLPQAHVRAQGHKRPPRFDQDPGVIDQGLTHLKRRQEHFAAEADHSFGKDLAALRPAVSDLLTNFPTQRRGPRIYRVGRSSAARTPTDERDWRSTDLPLTGLARADGRLLVPRLTFAAVATPSSGTPAGSSPGAPGTPDTPPQPQGPPLAKPRPGVAGTPVPIPPAPAPPLGGPLVPIDMGSIGGPVGATLIVNEQGEAGGIAGNGQGEFRPFFWNAEGGIIDLGTLGGFGGSSCGTPGCWRATDSRVLDLNDSGQAVGISRSAEGLTHGFFWSDKSGMIDIGSLGGDESVAVAVNELGQVIGSSRDADGRLRAFMWTREEGMKDLGCPEHLDCDAVAINDHGQVVGSAGFRAFIWSRETGMQRLGAEETFSQANAVNNAGVVAGTAIFDDSGLPRAFIWTAESGLIDMGSLEGRFPAGTALGVSEEGHVVGVASALTDLSLGLIEQRSFLWVPTRGELVLDLEGFGGRLDDYTPGLSVNDRGQVAGIAGPELATRSGTGFVWSESGGRVVLGNTEGDTVVSWAGSLNNYGEVGGSTQVRGDGAVLILRPTIWRPRFTQPIQSTDSLDGVRELLAGLQDIDPSLLAALNVRIQVAERKIQNGRSSRSDLLRMLRMLDVAAQRGQVSSDFARTFLNEAQRAESLLQ